jgi:hypothetical protein
MSVGWRPYRELSQPRERRYRTGNGHAPAPAAATTEPVTCASCVSRPGSRADPVTRADSLRGQAQPIQLRQTSQCRAAHPTRTSGAPGTPEPSRPAGPGRGSDQARTPPLATGISPIAAIPPASRPAAACDCPPKCPPAELIRPRNTLACESAAMRSMTFSHAFAYPERGHQMTFEKALRPGRPLTESNRRPSPYHGPLPYSVPQVERLTCPDTSPDQHRQAPGAPSGAPFATQSATHSDLAPAC